MSKGKKLEKGANYKNKKVGKEAAPKSEVLATEEIKPESNVEKTAVEIAKAGAGLVEELGSSNSIVVVIDSKGSLFAEVRASNHGALLLLEKMAKREVDRIFEQTAFGEKK